MFDQMKRINECPKPYEFYTAETLWNDEHISKNMLQFHLDEKADPASRNIAFIARSIEWMTSRFNIVPGTRIADFGCGPGLYTTPLAELGATVTGIDISERSINHARSTALNKGLPIQYLRQNYLDFTTDRKFDLITMIYCDFCALSPQQRSALLGIFRKHLEDDGVVLLDVFSLASFAQKQEVATYAHQLLNCFWSPNDYYGFLNTVRYEDEKIILDKYTIIEEARTQEVYNWLQYYSLKSLTEEFAENGFQIVEHYADVAGTGYKEGSPEIAIVAKKQPRS